MRAEKQSVTDGRPIVLSNRKMKNDSEETI